MYIEQNGNWYTYVIDERNFCILTGPFNGSAIIYAFSKMCIRDRMDSDLIKLVSNVNSYERENVVRLENSVELLLENLQ